MNKPVIFFLFALFFLFEFSFSAFSTDDLPVPVTEERLETLGLDRNYHRCISVADGDTLTLEGLGTVRFVGVDTPEKNHPQLPVQFLSKEAGAFTEKLCLGKRVRLEYDPYDEDKRGKYGRVLGYVYLEDGAFLQEELIKNGYAIAYTKYPLDAGRKARFLAWEQEAKTKDIGLWKDGGFAEILWILAQKQPLLQVTNGSKTKWHIGFGNRVLKPVPYGQIESHFEQLYAAIYEFSPRELQIWLSNAQYKPSASIDGHPSPIFIIGMAHRKWGIIYKNHALPRVLPGRLDEELLRLSAWMDAYPEEKLGEILLKNQYRFIPDRNIDSFEQRKIAAPFLTVKAVRAADENVVPWDLAGDYIGKNKFVEGKITRTLNSGKACFLNFHNNWTRYFSLVIFANVFHRFPQKPEEFYLNKFVRVKGRIKNYRGRPEIILNSPAQIEIIK